MVQPKKSKLAAPKKTTISRGMIDESEENDIDFIIANDIPMTETTGTQRTRARGRISNTQQSQSTRQTNNSKKPGMEDMSRNSSSTKGQATRDRRQASRKAQVPEASDEDEDVLLYGGQREYQDDDSQDNNNNNNNEEVSFAH